MQVRIVSIEDITPSQIVQWNAWAAPAGILVSPYLRFEFAERVARARADVRIAVIEADNRIIGYFPHHVPRGGVVRPVGAPMSDYQAVIAHDLAHIDLRELVRACGGSAIVFDNWLGPLDGRKASRRGREGSVVVDLAAGSDTYFETQRAAFRDHFKKTARRQRAATRDHGEVRVELGDPEGRAFRQLIDWKQRQYRDTGKLNVFGVDWVHALLGDLRRSEGQEFGGLTAALWFGDRLAAVEFGLVGSGVYHSWFPAYDPELAKYSPGLLLLHGLFEQAHERGIQRVDLGRGGTHYKKYYASYEVPLDHGRLLAPGMAALGIQSWEIAERAAGIMPDRIAQLPARARRRWSQVSAFEPRFTSRLANLATSISL